MKRWIPAPVDLLREADAQRWTREQPAPAFVGYASAWLALDDGRALTSRRLAVHLGWSEWSARSMLARVRSDRDFWFDREREEAPHAELTHDSHKTAQLKLVKSAACVDEARNLTRDSRDTRARLVSTVNKETSHSSKHTSDKASPALAALWVSVNALRAEHQPGSRSMKLTPGRRRALGSRVTEFGADAVLRVWLWALTSSHSRALYLREQGYCRPDTLHRSGKFADYAEMAKEWATREQQQSDTRAAAADIDAFLQ